MSGGIATGTAIASDVVNGRCRTTLKMKYRIPTTIIGASPVRTEGSHFGNKDPASFLFTRHSFPVRPTGTVARELIHPPASPLSRRPFPPRVCNGSRTCRRAANSFRRAGAAFLLRRSWVRVGGGSSPKRAAPTSSAFATGESAQWRVLRKFSGPSPRPRDGGSCEVETIDPAPLAPPRAVKCKTDSLNPTAHRQTNQPLVIILDRRQGPPLAPLQAFDAE